MLGTLCPSINDYGDGPAPVTSRARCSMRSEVERRHCEGASPTKQSRANGTSLAPLDCFASLAMTRLFGRNRTNLRPAYAHIVLPGRDGAELGVAFEVGAGGAVLQRLSTTAKASIRCPSGSRTKAA